MKTKYYKSIYDNRIIRLKNYKVVDIYLNINYIIVLNTLKTELDLRYYKPISSGSFYKQLQGSGIYGIQLKIPFT